MAEILKFVYIVILFVSLLLIVVASERECVTDDDCEKLYPTNEYRMMCDSGYCMNLLNEPPCNI
ncbi:putative Late nodulin [Medicago truncatula]|uniref:Nodule Cysteine-Rich (NCR) secreted peptide n=1 Tax=Medicago truncatula TaxID=3880 RepID=G7JDM1_MEDTR|nr:Nodule Cysteine-Rich (NCR) secreted peptide [Medicago truncatula]RHN61071.1 putative Late nodulin [Medicago truncatula]